MRVYEIRRGDTIRRACLTRHRVEFKYYGAAKASPPGGALPPDGFADTRALSGGTSAKREPGVGGSGAGRHADRNGTAHYASLISDRRMARRDGAIQRPQAQGLSRGSRSLSRAIRQDREALHRLLGDADAVVARAALRAAGELRNRAYLFETIRALNRAPLRGEAIRALTAFGSGITGTLSDVLNDDSVSIRVRRQIPRVLKNLPDQRSVTTLLPAIGHTDLTIRAAVLKALNRLRETAPQLNFDDIHLSNQPALERSARIL